MRVPGLCLEVPVRVPGLLEAATPLSASSASIQLPWTRRQGYLSVAASLSFTMFTLQAELPQLERIGGRARSRRWIPAQFC